MKIYDEDFNVIESPDLEAGCTVAESRRITHRWVVDVAEETHEEVVAEYPETGGKDVAVVVDVAERGHWETRTENGDPVDYDGEIPDDWPHDAEVPGVEEYLLYRPYTEEELAEIGREKEERERAEAEAAAQAAVLGQMRLAASYAVMSLELTDDQAMAVSALYPEWEAGAAYSTGDVRRYGGVLYRALQDSTGAAEHAPDVATSLWKRIGEPDPSGVFPWVQPLGATDAYMAGDRVTHGGKVWVSTVDNNVWEPGVYGWEAE